MLDFLVLCSLNFLKMEKATNGQFREFIGKLLVSGNDEKVALIDKSKIQNSINLLSSKDEVIIDNFIRFVNNGCNPQFIGNNEIDTDRTPNLPFSGASIDQHQKGGKMILDFSKINFYLSEKQKSGSIGGHDLRKELKSKKVLNACVLDYLLENPHLIPEDWKKDSKGNTRYIFFWGTIFRDSDGHLYVRCLYWHDGSWLSSYDWLDLGFYGDDPAAVSAS